MNDRTKPYGYFFKVFLVCMEVLLLVSDYNCGYVSLG